MICLSNYATSITVDHNSWDLVLLSLYFFIFLFLLVCSVICRSMLTDVFEERGVKLKVNHQEKVMLILSFSSNSIFVWLKSVWNDCFCYFDDGLLHWWPFLSFTWLRKWDNRANVENELLNIDFFTRQASPFTLRKYYLKLQGLQRRQHA